MMSSRLSPMTGMRLNPLRSASDIACRSVLLRSMKTTSVRGTMTSRAMVSPSSKTEWIISRSPDSMTWLASARSTSSRSSASDENGPSLNPRPGVRMLPTTINSCGSGPSTLVKKTTRPELSRATRWECSRPTVRGPTPISTNSITSITATVTRTASRSSWKSRSITSVTMTIAVISQSIRRNRAVFKNRDGSAVMSSSRREPLRPSATSSSARTFDMEASAASTLEKNPATTTRTAAATRRTVSPGLIDCSFGTGPGEDPLPLRQQPRLQPEHLRVLLGLAVVVAEQVQDPVDGQQVDLVGLGVAGLSLVAGLLGLPFGDLGAQDEVTEDSLLRLLVDEPRAQLVHRERQYVGRAGLVHPLLVEAGDRVLVDELDAQLGLRMDAQPLQDEPAEPTEPLDVALCPRLLEHLDAHAPVPPCRWPRA